VRNEPLSIVVGVHHGNLRKCWACTVGTEYDGGYPARPLTDRHAIRRQRTRWEWYETVVEFLEELAPDEVIRRPEVVRALGGGPAMFGIVQLAVQDMVLHGLLECVHTGRNGNCYGFAFRKGLK
jgi:hypothetical protein